ncbi:DUF4352 domain-containing protein [Metabacillus herbersteinensis]|uniref:DUF4352 domain-containing protein n=1 Tax=Metabacillus herbersteinensis TaxID=283816 RepID=A0ABV6GHC7_9BACI
MKKQFLLFLLLTLLLLGCSNNQLVNVASGKNSDSTKTEAEEETSVQQNHYDEYVLNPQVTNDQSLQKVGDSVTDEKGEATLKAIKNMNETVKIGPVEMTIKDVKVLHTKPDYSMIDFFHTYTHDQEFDFVKVFVEIKNTSNEEINFAPVAILETSTGEQKVWEDDIYLEELNGKLGANEKKLGNLGFIVEKSDMKSIDITTSDVFGQDEKVKEKSKKINIEF